MGMFTILLARRKHRYGLLVSTEEIYYILCLRAFIKTLFIIADESLRIGWSRVRPSLRPRHGHDHGSPHVEAARSSRMRLYSKGKVIIRVYKKIIN